jgi:hypothetical protein
VSEQDNHEHLPPPIGVHHEQPLSTNEALRRITEQDPDYTRWVLFRSEELMQRLDVWHRSGGDPRETDLKEDIAKLLIEAYELVEALRLNKELRKMFEGEAGA